jgi:polyisoprenoid-binding protein YceI
MGLTTQSAMPGLHRCHVGRRPRSVRFSIRHAIISKLCGRFTRCEGELVTRTEPLRSSATASIDLSSVATANDDRDDRIRSGGFFDVANHPVMTQRSTNVREAGDHYIVDGELSLHGVTGNVALKVDVHDFVESPVGTRAQFSASGELSRAAFGIKFNRPLEGIVIGDRVTVCLEVEAVLRTA